MPSSDDLARRYPSLFNFLDTTLWLDVDGVNLLELLHRTLRHAAPPRASQLVDEVEALANDRRLSDAALAELLTRGVPPAMHAVTPESARSFVRMLGGYLRYLRDSGALSPRAPA